MIKLTCWLPNFSSEQTIESKRLSEGVQSRHVWTCLRSVKKLKICRFTRFISHYLDELPPVWFGGINTLMLSKVGQLSWEVFTVRRAGRCRARRARQVGVGPAGQSGAGVRLRWSGGIIGATNSEGTTLRSCSLVQSFIVKERQLLKLVLLNVATQTACHATSFERRPEKRGLLTAALRLTFKLMSVFATRFSPNVDADTLHNWLRNCGMYISYRRLTQPRTDSAHSLTVLNVTKLQIHTVHNFGQLVFTRLATTELLLGLWVSGSNLIFAFCL